MAQRCTAIPPRTVPRHGRRPSIRRWCGRGQHSCILARLRTTDVVDAHLIAVAIRLAQPILTGDITDLEALAASLPDQRPRVRLCGWLGGFRSSRSRRRQRVRRVLRCLWWPEVASAKGAHESKGPCGAFGEAADGSAVEDQHQSAGLVQLAIADASHDRVGARLLACSRFAHFCGQFGEVVVGRVERVAAFEFGTYGDLEKF